MVTGYDMTMCGLLIMFAMCGGDEPKDPREKVIMIERKHLKIVFLGETAVLGCQGGTGRQDGYGDIELLLFFSRGKSY
jgi:hypothetical protein